MSIPICRLLPYTVAAGPQNMAADEALLERAAAGIASVRFYGWSEATVSLGYFQLEDLLTKTAAIADAGYPANDDLVIDGDGTPHLKRRRREDRRGRRGRWQPGRRGEEQSAVAWRVSVGGRARATAGTVQK